MTTATRTLAPRAQTRLDDRLRSRRPDRRAAAPVAPPEVTTVLVITVAGEVDDAWLADLDLGGAGASIRRLAAADRPRAADGTAVANRDLLVSGEVRMDLGRHEVTAGDRGIALTHQEFLLLRTFLRHPGQLLSRSWLLHDAWGRSGSEPQRTVDVHVRRLRVKLGPAASRLVTVRGFGYRFEE